MSFKESENLVFCEKSRKSDVTRFECVSVQEDTIPTRRYYLQEKKLRKSLNNNKS